MSRTAAHQTTPPVLKGETRETSSRNSRDTFLIAALNMSWQLAIVVLIPIIGGVQLDKTFDTSTVFTFVGLGVALVGSVFVMWRALQAANRLPVPKVSAAQKRAIQKQYEDEDNE